MPELYAFEDLSVGLTAKFSKTVTEADIVLFAAVTGDTNPMHLDAEYAATSIFKERIAHFPDVKERIIRFMIVAGEVVLERRTKRRGQ